MPKRAILMSKANFERGLIKQLTKNFGENTALKDLNLVIPAGSIYGIIRLSGAGKSV